ncbi:MAG: hypothetical protein LW808_002055 [Verrucomicrobiota bacterium]|nr:MAG: hypothetical protein LW808_002055 [Verrucomicrobiota bacterium]
MLKQGALTSEKGKTALKLNKAKCHELRNEKLGWDQKLESLKETGEKLKGYEQHVGAIATRPNFASQEEIRSLLTTFSNLCQGFDGLVTSVKDRQLPQEQISDLQGDCDKMIAGLNIAKDKLKETGADLCSSAIKMFEQLKTQLEGLLGKDTADEAFKQLSQDPNADAPMFVPDENDPNMKDVPSEPLINQELNINDSDFNDAPGVDEGWGPMG